jgi:hypothetical protein
MHREGANDRKTTSIDIDGREALAAAVPRELLNPRSRPGPDAFGLPAPSCVRSGTSGRPRFVSVVLDHRRGRLVVGLRRSRISLRWVWVSWLPPVLGDRRKRLDGSVTSVRTVRVLFEYDHG